jgi:hypothetical protein
VVVVVDGGGATVVVGGGGGGGTVAIPSVLEYIIYTCWSRRRGRNSCGRWRCCCSCRRWWRRLGS